MLNLRNGKCHMSVIFFLMSLSFMSHVDFKKLSCCHVGFKGQEPHIQYYRLRAVWEGVGGGGGGSIGKKWTIHILIHLDADILSLKGSINYNIYIFLMVL